MRKILAHAISWLFNPIFLLFPVPYFLVLRETGNIRYALEWTAMTLIFLGMTGVFVLYGVRKGYFTDLDVSKREQRLLLFYFVAIISLVYFSLLFILNGPVVLFISLSGIFFSLLVFGYLNTRVKASIHVASVTALIFSLAVLYGGYYLLLLFLIPLVAWARIEIKRHTRVEVVAGGLAGIVIPAIMYILFKVLLGISVSL